MSSWTKIPKKPGRVQLSEDEWDVKAREIVLRKLDQREQSRAELAAALLEAGVPEGVANHVLVRFEEVGLIDDQRFAELWAAARRRSKGLSVRAIKVELHGKGISDHDAELALAKISPDDEWAAAVKLVESRAATIPASQFATREGKARAYRKLVGVLARKGYSPSLISEVVNQVIRRESAGD